MLNISLSSEYVLFVAGLKLTNTFLTTLVVSFLLISFVALTAFASGRKKKEVGFISGAARILVLELLHLIDTVTEDREMTKRVLPLVATFFIFIVTANIIGLLPGFLGSFYLATATGHVPLLRSPNSDLTTTLALALFSVFAIQYYSLRSFGLFGYLKRFINFTNPIAFILGFFELISEVVKVLSFSFRLFGNIFAGEVLLLVMGFLVPYVIPVPFMLLEVFVGVIQAFIFSILTLTFIKTSSVRHAQAIRA